VGFIDDLLGGVFDGLGWVWDNTAGRAANAIWDQITSGLVSWVVDAIAFFVRLLLRFFEQSSTPDVLAGWFAGKSAADSGVPRVAAGADTPFQVVAYLALGLMLLFVLAGIIQGLAMGEGPAMAARLARDVAVAMLGLIAVLAVTQALLGLTDELSTGILQGTEAGHRGLDVLRALSDKSAIAGSSTFVMFLVGLVVVVAAFFVWVELLIRGAMLYVVVALAPLAFAASVWPAARGIPKKLAEIALALIFSKVVIAIAISVSAAALSNGSRGGLVPNEAKIGTMLMGAIMFLLSAFAPFVLLKLFPVAEAALIAQGLSRGPWRSFQTGMQSTFYMSRLTGGSGGGSSPRALPAGKSDPGGSAGAGGAPGSGSGGGAAGGGAGAGGGSGAAAGGGAGGAAAAGPAAAVVAGVATARAGVRAAGRSVGHSQDTLIGPPPASSAPTPGRAPGGGDLGGAAPGRRPDPSPARQPRREVPPA